MTIYEQIENLDRKVIEFWKNIIEESVSEGYRGDEDFTRDNWIACEYEIFMTEREDDSNDIIKNIGTKFITTELMTHMIETIHNLSPLPLPNYSLENILCEYVDYYRLNTMNEELFKDIIDDYDEEQNCLYVLK